MITIVVEEAVIPIAFVVRDDLTGIRRHIRASADVKVHTRLRRGLVLLVAQRGKVTHFAIVALR